MEKKPNKIRNTAITLFIFAIYLTGIGCGKTSFSAAPAHETGAASNAVPTVAPAVPTPMPAATPAPGPAPAPAYKTWQAFGSSGMIGIYKGSAAKYGINYAPVIGTPCDWAEPQAIDIRTCQDNGVICTVANDPNHEFFCCSDLHYYTCQ